MRTLRRLALCTLLATVLGGSAAAQAALPRVSPNDVRRTFIAADANQSCRYAYLCAFVPYKGGFYAFDFTRCKTYRLSNFFGTGTLVNAQFGGVRFRLSDRQGRLIKSGTARRVYRGIDWDPVYYVRPC